MSLLLVAVAGAAGATARYVLDGLVTTRLGTRRPWGTFAVNVLGSFGLGVLAGLALHFGLTETVRLAVGVGFFGAFTTFSTWMLETVRLAERGDWRSAGAQVAGSLVAGVVAVGIGISVGAGLG
jgi:fluoride exporter